MFRLSLVVVVVACGTTVGATPDPTAPDVGECLLDTDNVGSIPPRTDPTGNRTARVVAVLPNPVAEDDSGEYVVVEFPEQTNLSKWRLDDGENRVGLPARELGGRIVVTPDPGVVRNRTDRPVVAIDHLALSNAGETVALQYGNATVDAATYDDAPERERWTPSGWTPVGATDRPVTEHGAASVQTFVLPDAPGVPLAALSNADERILLAGYSFGSRRITRTLVRAADRGVRVRVLVDAAPVGGMSEREARLLDRLVAAGVEVRAFGGGRAPYDFHHAKYAVVDDRAMVLTENYKPAGTGGHSSRGWGVVVADRTLAADLAGLFRTDSRNPKAVPWTQIRAGASLRNGSVAETTYPSRFRPRRFRAESVRVLVAPDNAERAVVGLLENASESVRVEQMEIERGPFLAATVAAARRGVRVRVLVSGAWYVRKQNRRVVAALNARARRENLDLRAKVVEPRSRFEKVHAKGVVVDGDVVVLGSLNWNNHSARQNREVALMLEGDRIGEYYADVFRADWRGGLWWAPVGTTVLLVATLGLALAVGRRRISFESATGADQGVDTSRGL